MEALAQVGTPHLEVRTPEPIESAAATRWERAASSSSSAITSPSAADTSRTPERLATRSATTTVRAA